MDYKLMAENNDDNDPFEEDIIFDQTDLLHEDNRAYHLNISQHANIMPRFFLFIRTVSLCVAFVGLGLCASLSQGPIIQIEIISGISTNQALHIFTAYCLGMLMGGILGSWLFEKYNRQFLIFMCLLFIGGSISILPFTVFSSFGWTLLFLVAIGTGLSFMFTGGNVLCLDMWGKNGAGYLVSVHFSFALGAFLAPIVIRPFIMNPNFPTQNNSTNLLERNPRNIVSDLVHFPYPKKFQNLYGTTETTLPPSMQGLVSKFNLKSVVTRSPLISTTSLILHNKTNTSSIEANVPNWHRWSIENPSTVANYVPPNSSNHSKNNIPTMLSKPATFSNGSTDKVLNMIYGLTGMHIAYIIIGIFMLLNAIISLTFLCISPREAKSKQIDTNFAMISKRFITLCTVSFAIYMFSTEAIQGSVHHFLAVSSLISKSSDGQAIFWGLICSVRFLCIFITGCCSVRPEKILLGCNLIMLLGTVLLCVGTFNKHDFLISGIVIIAIGIAPVLPICFLWMSNMMKVTHKMCAFMIIVSSTGNSLTHISLTFILSDSHLYAYIMVIISICSIFFLFLSLYMAKKLRSSLENCFRDCSITPRFDDEEGLSMLVSEPRDNNRSVQHRMADLDGSNQALLID